MRQFFAFILSSILSFNLFSKGVTTVNAVVTSFYPLYFFTSQITGDQINVINITPPGTEPHDYELSPSDTKVVENASLLILNGGNLETWGNKVSPKSGKFIYASDSFTSKDPHTWLSPKHAIKEVRTILNGLINVYPTQKNQFENNAALLISKLETLDRKYQTGLKNCQTRDFVTSHLAFSYLAADYNLNQVAISGISPDEEPSLKQMAQVVDFVKINRIKYIFFETLLSSKLADTISQETGAKTLVLNPIEGLTKADMKAGKNYITIMEDNLANLRTALSCN
jgi:zinc transport system substrate-binding protein